MLIVVALLPIKLPGEKIVNKYSFGLYLCPLVTGVLKPLPLPHCPAQSLAHEGTQEAFVE